MRQTLTSGKWDGRVYNSRDGQTYSGSITMLGPDNLELKGCVAIVLCKTETWTRATEPEQDELPSSATGVPFKNRGVPLKRASGTLLVPVQINGAITLDFTVDSGASDVVIPADVFSTLIRTGTIKQSDLIGQQTHILAYGSNLQLSDLRDQVSES